MFGYIYKTTNQINGKIYIGKHKGDFDAEYFGSGSYLNNSINKYGRDKFHVEVIDTCDSLDDQNAKERYWIAYYRATDAVMYNIADGGDGGDTFSGMTLESRLRRIENLRKNSYFTTMDPALRRNFHAKMVATRKANGGYIFDKVARQHMSEAQKNRPPMSRETIQKISDTRMALGYKHSPETIAKIVAKTRGQKRTLEQRRQQSLHLKGTRTGVENNFYGKRHSDEVKQHLRELFDQGVTGRAGQIWMTDGTNNISILPEEQSIYEDKGYYRGRAHYKHKHPMSDERRKQISETLKGNTPWNKGLNKSENSEMQNCGANKGGIFMNNGLINKVVKQEEVVIYIEAGFKMGMKPRKGKI